MGIIVEYSFTLTTETAESDSCLFHNQGKNQNISVHVNWLMYLFDLQKQQQLIYNLEYILSIKNNDNSKLDNFARLEKALRKKEAFNKLYLMIF